MEAAALDKIIALANGISERIGHQTGGEALYLPLGATLGNAETYASAPRFHRHRYSTERLNDFIAYARASVQAIGARAAEPGAVPHKKPTAYVLPDGGGAVAVFDHGDTASPQWGHHRATLKLRQSPPYIAALAMSRGVHTQQQMIDWIEDWSPELSVHAQDGAVIDNTRAITALRRVKLEVKGSATHVEGDFARQKTAMESIEASGDVETLPAYFVLHSPLYVGTVEHEIVLRLSVREDNGKPALALRIVGAERLAEITSTWVEAQLTEQLDGVLDGVYVGVLEIGKP